MGEIRLNKNSRIQGKTWTFLIYPDSAPDDWDLIFEDLHVSGAYSMVHDPDKDGGKPHIHAILEFGSNMGIETVKRLIEPFHSPTPFLVYDKPRMYRYLSHLDEKDKKHYDPNDVTYFNVPYWEYINTQGGISDTMNDICDWINKNECSSFKELYNHALFTNNLNWMSFISTHVFFFNSFLKG